VCIYCSRSVEGPKSQFGSRSLKIQDQEVTQSRGEKGGCASVYLCDSKIKCNINGSQGLEFQTNLKWDMASGTMESLVVTVLDIWETLVPCTWLL
jgi:hypothetical protein